MIWIWLILKNPNILRVMSWSNMHHSVETKASGGHPVECPPKYIGK